MLKSKTKSSISIIIELFPYLWSMRARLIIASIFTVASIALTLSIPLIFKHIINMLVNKNDSSQFLITIILIGYGICWTFNQLIQHFRSLVIFRLLERGSRLLSLKIFDHVLSLSLRFHMARRTGALTSYINRAQYGFDNIFWGIISFLVPVTLELLIVIIIISKLFGMWYGIAMFAIVFSYVSLSFLALKSSIDAQEIDNEKRAASQARIVDALLNYETVKYFNNEAYEFESADKALKEQEDAGTRKFIKNAIIQIWQVLAIGVGLSFMTVLSGQAVYQGNTNLGEFVMVNGYLLQFLMPLNHFSYIMHQIKKGLHDIKPILEILDQEPEIQDASHAIELKPKKTEILFNNVTFGYEADRTILHGISFFIEAKKTYAIVGPSGAGKSTISRLLFRFYDVNSGSILINGHDIRTIKQTSLHSLIGIVPQDTVLFNDTIYYNIAYGNPQASQNEVIEAARMAYLDQFISSLPQKYETLVGERGLKLSGGEKQRVAIARAILKKPALFIFDEATSSLDSHTEREIQKNLQEISCNTTTIIIAHRLSTIIHADAIMVIDGGKIVERGSHNDLLKLHGFYEKLWTKQRHEENRMII